MKKTIRLISPVLLSLFLFGCFEEGSSTGFFDSVSSEESSVSSSSQGSVSLLDQDDESLSLVYHTVTFKNYDDSILDSVSVLEGTQAYYSKEVPSRPEDDEFVYSFCGWDRDLTCIMEDCVTFAQYIITAKTNWGEISWF